MEFAEINDIRSMEVLRDQWDGLAASAAEPNPFYEAWALEPAFEHLSRGAGPSLVCVWSSSAARELIGVFPVARRCGYHRIPIPHRGLWRHVHCFLTTPLMKRGEELTAWRGLLEWSRQRGPLLELDGLAADGPVFQALLLALNQSSRRYEVRSIHQRPLLAPTVAPEVYLDLALRKRRRRQFERKWELLAQQGAVSFSSANDETTLQEWLTDFIELESQGWKGRGRTAIQAQRNEEAYFRALVRRGASRGKVRAYRLAAANRPVAMRFDLVTHQAAFALKIAYDENFSRSSPGALLEIEILREFLQRRDLSFVDSCTVPSPDSIHGYFWQERRAIGALVIATPTLMGNSLMALGQAARALKAPRFPRVGAPPRGERAELPSR